MDPIGPEREPSMYDALQRAREVAEVVCRGDERKYYRFRAAGFYGGIATADCVGCCLSCVFCWSWLHVESPEAQGRFYSPRQVARALSSIARRKRFDRVRISGNEPTLSRSHLLEVLDLVPKDLLFILETNGILLGHDPGFARELASFPNLHVRVSLKGATEDEFARLTGAEPQGFALQLAALQHLHEAGVCANPAIMVSFSSSEDLRTVGTRLARISPRFADFEIEELRPYGQVEERLARAGISPRRYDSM